MIFVNNSQPFDYFDYMVETIARQQAMRDKKQEESTPKKTNKKIQDNVNNYIDKVVFNDPATIILWKDGTKTIVKVQEGDKFSKECGFAMAVCKKVFGNTSYGLNETMKKYIPNY